ncbi:MAG: hypothetical protein ACP5N3_02625 [Candidatus Nanoarchaeia archaeon]
MKENSGENIEKLTIYHSIIPARGMFKPITRVGMFGDDEATESRYLLKFADSNMFPKNNEETNDSGVIKNTLDSFFKDDENRFYDNEKIMILNSSQEVQAVNAYFNIIFRELNIPELRKALIFLANAGLKVDKGYDLSKFMVPDYDENLNQKGMGSIDLTVNWNIIFGSKFVNIPQDYVARLNIMADPQQDAYRNRHRPIANCISLVPVDRQPLKVAYFDATGYSISTGRSIAL